jgi:DnaA-homolog protein
VSFPGHFLVKLHMPRGEVVIDPFTGHSLSREQLDERLLPFRRQRGLVGDFEAPLGLFLQAAAPRDVIARLLRNLKEIFTSSADWSRLLAVQERLVILLPDAPGRSGATAAWRRPSWAAPTSPSPTWPPIWPRAPKPPTRRRCAANSAFGSAAAVRACIDEADPAAHRPRDAADASDNFIAGSDANAAALAHLRALPERDAPPVYLWGPSGSGKTHLLRALLGQRQRAGRRTGSFEAATPAPWTCEADWAAVAIDDCQALDAERQQAAFALFVEAQMHGVPLLAAGRLPPVDLPLREDLRTRLAWGHVYALQPLLEHETRAVLRREAGRRGIFLSDDVLSYLMTRFERDLSST